MKVLRKEKDEELDAMQTDIIHKAGEGLKDRLEHGDEVKNSEDDYYWYDYGDSIKRTLFIEDVLYTISDNFVKMNSLDDLSEINVIELV